MEEGEEEGCTQPTQDTAQAQVMACRRRPLPTWEEAQATKACMATLDPQG